MERFSAKIDTSVERDGVQHRQRSEDRHHADHDRQGRGEQPAEHPDQDQGKLSGTTMASQHQQVPLGLLVTCRFTIAVPPAGTEDTVPLAHDRVGELPWCQRCCFGLGADDAGDDQPGLAVGTEQTGGSRRQQRPRRCDGATRPEG